MTLSGLESLHSASGGDGMSSRRWLLATPGGLELRTEGPQSKEGSRKMGTLPGARTTEGSGPSKCPSGWASLSPLPEEGVFKGVDLLVSITPPGLTLPLLLSLWKPGISFRDPHSNQPCFHGDPTIPHQLPSCHNNSRDYQLFPQPRALCDSPHHLSPASFSCLGNKDRQEDTLVAPL